MLKEALYHHPYGQVLFAMTLYEKIPLPNGLTLEIWDNSRTIAADTTKVELVARIEVAFDPVYFPERERYDRLVRALGDRSLFEYRKIRTFVSSAKKEEVFQELLDAFRQDSLPYLSKEDFPRRFALSKLRDVEQHAYRYEIRQEEN